MLNAWDKSPVSAQIGLYVGAAAAGGQLASHGVINYGSWSTNSDGSFDIKSNAQWNGDDYTLLIVPDGSQINCSVGKNKSIDVGDIIVAGSFTINCKITLHSISGASITFSDIGKTTPQVTSFSAGTNTVVTASKVYYGNSGGYGCGNNCYHIVYKLSTSSADSNKYVPLQPPSDNTSVTINY